MASRGVLDGWGHNNFAFEGKMDIDYFLDQPNAAVSQVALDFLSDGGNQFQLAKRHSPQEVEKLWKGTYRRCIANGVELTRHQREHASFLGVVFL